MKNVSATIDDEAARRKRLQDRTLRAIKGFRGGDRMPRDEIHGRGNQIVSARTASPHDVNLQFGHD